MSVERFFAAFQLAALGCLAWLAVTRASALRARGIRVLVEDRQRTPAQLLVDLLTVICLLAWWVELIAHASCSRVRLPPRALDSVVLDLLAVKVAGLVLMAAGLVVYGLALQAMGSSWRLGIDRDTPGDLVTDGIFAWTRNPIYLSLFLLLLGTLAIQGRLVYLALAFGLMVGTHATVRREERFLEEAHGQAYQEYCSRVGRYLTLRRPASGGQDRPQAA